MTSANTDLAIFEEITTDLVATESKKVPFSVVFGRGTVGDIQSFGGKTLSENTALVDQAVTNTQELQHIWNHSHSQWSWKSINFSYHSPYKNMRQIAAEMAGRKNALNEAKWRFVKNELKLRKYEEELFQGQETGTLEKWREIELKIKIAELKETMLEGNSYIEGAMKDILALNDMYEQLKSKVNSFSEQDVELEETKSHLKRSIVQCIRDVRQSGHISKGEQEYAEQIGVNPSKLQEIIRAYVNDEKNQDSWDVSGLYSFVDDLTTELADVYNVNKVRMSLQGFSDEPSESYGYSTKVALPKE